MLIQELQPVQMVVHHVLDALKHNGYASATMKKYAASYRRLMEYMEARDLEHFTQEVGLAYMNRLYEPAIRVQAR